MAGRKSPKSWCSTTCLADELLRLVASAEQRSEHPIARAIVRAATQRNLSLSEPEEFTTLPGQGVHAIVDAYELTIGNERLYRARSGDASGVVPPAVMDLLAMGQTVVLISAEDRLLGAIAVADLPRSNARSTVEALRALGIPNIVMLTGDHEQVARRIAAELGITDVRAGLLPADKVTVVHEYQTRGKAAMVGDGVNDAPALAVASVGIAMGVAGADVALETADVVLMSDDLSKLPLAMKLARRSRRIIAQNMVIALGMMALLVAGDA